MRNSTMSSNFVAGVLSLLVILGIYSFMEGRIHTDFMTHSKTIARYTGWLSANDPVSFIEVENIDGSKTLVELADAEFKVHGLKQPIEMFLSHLQSGDALEVTGNYEEFHGHINSHMVSLN